MQYQNLSDSFGKPGGPGSVRVVYFGGLYEGSNFSTYVGKPGKGGKGGPTGKEPTVQEEEVTIAYKGGAGGGRENVPLIIALRRYAESLQDTSWPPFIFDEPGDHQVVWPFKDVSTATMVIINPGGGGGGGAGDVVEGEEGEEGLTGITIIFPTDLPLVRDKT